VHTIAAVVTHLLNNNTEKEGGREGEGEGGKERDGHYAADGVHRQLLHHAVDRRLQQLLRRALAVEPGPAGAMLSLMACHPASFGCAP